MWAYEIFIPIAIVVGIGLVLGLVLAVAAIILHVPVKSRNRKHEYQVNFSLAMKICFDFLRGVAPPNVESLISKYILPIRPDRNYARQHRVQKPASFSYRFV